MHVPVFPSACPGLAHAPVVGVPRVQVLLGQHSSCKQCADPQSLAPLPVQVTEVSKVIGEMWGKVSDKEKEKYQKKADEVGVVAAAGARLHPSVHNQTAGSLAALNLLHPQHTSLTQCTSLPRPPPTPHTAAGQGRLREGQGSLRCQEEVKSYFGRSGGMGCQGGPGATAG